MKKFIDPCCPECFNSKENPCTQFIECCLAGPLCHENPACKEKREAIIQRLAHSPGYRDS